MTITGRVLPPATVIPVHVPPLADGHSKSCLQNPASASNRRKRPHQAAHSPPVSRVILCCPEAYDDCLPSISYFLFNIGFIVISFHLTFLVPRLLFFLLVACWLPPRHGWSSLGDSCWSCRTRNEQSAHRPSEVDGIGIFLDCLFRRWRLDGVGGVCGV